jgi:hypothetical protein
MLMMKVVQVNPTDLGLVVVVQETRSLPITLEPGQRLRCSGYRFEVVSVNPTTIEHQVGLVLKSQFGVQPGMLLRVETDPVSPEETVSQMMRLNTLFQLLAEFDSVSLLRALKDEQNEATQLVARLDAAAELERVVGALQTAKESFPPIDEQRMLSAKINQVHNKYRTLDMDTAASARIGG